MSDLKLYIIFQIFINAIFVALWLIGLVLSK